jgi:hypothetical protein
MIPGLTGINTKAALHQLVKTKLDSPDWYGLSWAFFWDRIITIAKCPIN